MTVPSVRLRSTALIVCVPTQASGLITPFGAIDVSVFQPCVEPELTTSALNSENDARQSALGLSGSSKSIQYHCRKVEQLKTSPRSSRALAVYPVSEADSR